jgi:putative transposase
MEWLSEVDSQSLQMAVRNLDNAFTRFFKEKKGFPKFKSKKASRESFQLPQRVSVDFDKSLLNIPKFREGISAVFHRRFEGKVKTVTISRTPTNKYYASILVENDAELPSLPQIEESSAIGIDTGIKTFLTISDGRTFENPKFLKKSARKLRRLQRQHSRSKKGSNRREKSRKRLARQYEKVTNQRRDYIHKVTANLTSDSQVRTICIEDLNVKGMVKNRNLAKSLHDVSLGLFYEILTYKCQWRGINLVQIGRFEPSSKICNCCGYVKNDLTLKDRSWWCPNCQVWHDRDLNASINIKKFGLIKGVNVVDEKPISSPRNRRKLPSGRGEVTHGEIRVSGSLNREKVPHLIAEATVL